MAEAGVDGKDMAALAASLLQAGFRVDRGLGRDELGTRFAVEEEATRQTRTLRVVLVAASPRQRRALDRLWDGLALLPPHPGLSRIIRCGVAASGWPWVVTDDSEHQSLADRMALSGALQPADVAVLTTSIAAALQHLHDSGLVHGGVSPVSIVTSGPTWRLADVGLAQILLPLPPLDQASAIGEVSAHAAPEVLAGDEVTPASDVYALGATLAEAITGAPLVRRLPIDTVGTLLGRHPSEDVALPILDPPGLTWLVEGACRRDPSRRPAAMALANAVDPLPGPRLGETSSDEVLDDDVQFTVYRPAAIPPGRWCTMVAFAHKTEPADPDFGPPDPVAEVKRQARTALGDAVDSYVTAAEEAASSLARGSEVTFVPQMDGVAFNPPSASFHWLEAVHREEFRLRASPALAGKRARGRLSVFLGNLLVAEVNLTIRVSDQPQVRDPAPRLEPERARPYRRIFVSYSHRDAEIVTHIGMISRLLGDEFVRDCTHLRAGEVWSEQLEALVRSADVFQLFWSTNSMASPFVRQEWEYALALGRDSFVRPCYWEDPLPARPAEDLPPAALRRLHFHRFTTSDRPVVDGTIVTGGMGAIGGTVSLGRPPPLPTGGSVPRPGPASPVDGPSSSAPPPVGSSSPPHPAPGPPRRRSGLALAAAGSLGVAASLLVGLLLVVSTSGQGTPPPVTPASTVTSPPPTVVATTARRSTSTSPSTTVAGSRSFPSVDALAKALAAGGLACARLRPTSVPSVAESGECFGGGERIGLAIVAEADRSDPSLVFNTVGGPKLVGANWILQAQTAATIRRAQAILGGTAR